jgi:pyruvate dehydrogenase E2 component (dihydrolipoamide acetyltransferase)
MARLILMPRPGQMTEECTLLTWLKAEGDPVATGDVLFEIETDKAVMEVEPSMPVCCSGAWSMRARRCP